MTFTTSIEYVAQEFRADSQFSFSKSYNVAPTQMVPVVTSKDGKHRELSLKRWGLIPPWAREISIGNHMINARSETLAEKPSFKTAYQTQRCIVPVSGFYEWDKEGGTKQPYYFYPGHKDILALAGLWESWEDPNQLVESFTIVTTSANDFMRPIHDRMPVIIQPDYYEQWLNCREYPGQDVGHLLKAAPNDELLSHPVSKFVNSPTNNSWKCINKI